MLEFHLSQVVFDFLVRWFLSDFSQYINHTEMPIFFGPTFGTNSPNYLVGVHPFDNLFLGLWKHQEVPKWSLWASNMPPMYGRRAFHQCCRTGCLIHSLRRKNTTGGVHTHTHPKNHRTSTWTTWKKDMFFWKIINFRWNIASFQEYRSEYS